MKQTTADRLYLLLVDRLRVIGGTRHAAEDIAAEINALTAERDEAQRLIGIYSTSRDAVIAQLGEMNDALRAEVERLQVAQQSDAVYLADYAKKIGRLGADVERLRPAAEAWEAWREYDELVSSMPFTRDTDQEQAVQDAATKRSEAYARARAAKEAKP